MKNDFHQVRNELDSYAKYFGTILHENDKRLEKELEKFDTPVGPRSKPLVNQ